MSDYLWLNPVAQVGAKQDVLYIRSGRKGTTVDGLGTVGVDFVKSLDGSKTESELRKSKLGPLLLPILQSAGLLVRLARPLRDTITDKPWLARQLAYWSQICPNKPDQIPAHMENQSIVVVGCGGIGTAVALTLAASNLGHIVLVDPDQVEASNLNRQFLYCQQDIGFPKVNVLQRSLQARFPRVEVTSMTAAFLDVADHWSVAEADMVVLAGGVEEAFANPKLLQSRKALVVGYLGSEGIVGPLVGTKGSPCWACFLEGQISAEVIAPPATQSGLAGWNASGTTINLVVGGMASEVIVRALCPHLFNADLSNIATGRHIVDMKTLVTRHESISATNCRCNRN